MTKVKLILGGVGGAVGLAGAALVPSLMSSENKVNSGGKAVAKSWSASTDRNTSFSSFSEAFAPFLIDIDRTDDVFWKKRIEQTKGKEFDHGKIFSQWDKISSEQERISKIKSGCKRFQDSIFKGSDVADIGKMMDLCGVHDPEQNKSKLVENASLLTSSDNLTAEQVCKLLVSHIAKDTCEKIGVTVTGGSTQ